MNIKIFKKHILTGMSYMVPVVVGAGITLALSVILGGTNVGDKIGTIPYYLNKIGSLGMGMIVPAIAAYIAYSIADRPGIAPGLIIGLVCSDTGAGFLGGIIGGFLVGYVVNFIKKYLKVPKSMSGLMPVLIIPVLATVICGLLMYLVIGVPITLLMNTITSFLQGLDSGSLFLYGAILGAGVSIDYGGPIAKAVFLFATSLAVDGTYGPQAAVMVGCMIPPMGVIVAFVLSKMFKKNIFTSAERETIKTCLPMGMCMITECVIPIAMNDLIRVISSSLAGGFVAGGLSMLWGCGSPVPAGGWFVIPLFDNPLGFAAALLIGSMVMGGVLFLLKRRVVKEEEDDMGDIMLNASCASGDIKIDIM